MKLSGTYCASLTPLNKDFSINHEVFFDHCNKLLDDGADGIAIFGTTGESNLLSLEAKMEATQSLIDMGLSPSKLLPGTGLASMNESIKLSTYMKNLQITYVLMLPSFYYNDPSDQGVVDYYSNIVESINDKKFRVLLYHIPQVSGVSINLNIIENLIRKYPDNIVGIKDSSNDLNNMIETARNFPDFSVFSGSDSLALPLMQKGGAGAITATANVSVSLLSYIVKNANDKSKNKILEEVHILQDIIRKVVFSQEQISFMKAIMQIMSQKNVWENIMPPLISLKEIKSNKNIQEALKLLEQMKKLSANF